MKRFVIATASALILLAGSAAASVPNGAGPRLARDNSFSYLGNGGPGLETIAPEGLPSLVPGVDPAVLPEPGAIPGLPEDVTQLLATVDPALANLVDSAGAPVAGALSPVVAPPAPVPGLIPGEPKKSAQPKSGPARKQSKGVTRKAALQALATPDVFKDLPAGGHAAYGTASVIHTNLLQVGGQRLENTDVAHSGATFSSVQLPQPITNEMSRVVAPALAAGNAYGRGSGLEVGLAIGQSDPNQIIPGSVAEAKAPPSTQLVTKEVGPVNVPPVLGASLLRGQAQSKANAACTTGTDLSYGLGYAADLGLLTAGGNPTVSSTAADPTRAVSQSRSRTFLVPQEGASSPIRKFGLASETRQTIAPVTLFKGTPQEFTLEFAGEWVLRATADGNKGSVFYGPGDVSPQTKILSIFGPAVTSPLEVTTQALLGASGLNLTVPGVAEIVIGEKPRALSGAAGSEPTQTGTAASGAVDVVRIRLLAGSAAQVADIRIGHMEVATAVPAGGIECGIGLVKNSDKTVVGPGDDFTWTIKVTNPNDCVLTQLKVVDTITATTGIIWTVTGASPTANQMGNNNVTWNDIGPLNPGQSKDLMINVKLANNTGGGKFLDVAEATGVCGPAAGTAGADAAVGVPLQARVELNLPEVNAVQAGNLLPRELPRTGGLLVTVVPALALTAGGMVLRRAKRRKDAAA
ncbi:MAG TPA: hypothetical protein VEG38_18960 [Acidimicrobiia bacterium]|nr:hypothetical protein [Acidimicrobiia bacterium]